MLKHQFLFLLFLLLVMGQGESMTTRTIDSVYVDPADQVHLVYSNGQDVQMPKEKDQVSTQTPVIAPDHETVGWAVETPNCCTSYPIPTTLVIYRSGRVMQRINDGMMVYKWQFLARGRQVAVSSGTVHGMEIIHLTLYDSRTGKQLKTWNGEDDEVPPTWGAQIAH